MGTSSKSQTVPNSSVNQSIPTAGKPPKIPNNYKGKWIDMGTKKEVTPMCWLGIRIGSLIERREDNQVTEGGSMGNLTAGEYQHKMDMEALAEAENEANDLYWENMAKEFRDDELNRPEDSLEAAYSFDIISEFQDNELNMHQVSMDLPVNEAPENYTTEESQIQDPYPKPTIPTQESQIQTRSKIRKRVVETTSFRIYVKNMGRSERIDAGKEVQV
ncbi:hypothetical protein Tco_0270169 [Tanacetum coccineum]